MPAELITLAGLAVIVGFAVLLSTDRRQIDLRIVLAALALQCAVAAFALYVPIGRAIFNAMSSFVLATVGHASAGIQMVFGDLAPSSKEFSFAINVLPIVVFFSALMSVLYHLRIMDLVVRIVGGAIKLLLGTRHVESMNAAANIFVGLTESPLAVRPYLNKITDAQLFAIMVSGVASVAGSVLAAYSQLGIRLDYLLAASFMAAPGGLAMASIIMPEEKGSRESHSETISRSIPRSNYPNVIAAAASGTTTGLKLAANIGAMLIAFVSLIDLGNSITEAIGAVFGVQDLSVQALLGTIFAPLMYLLGSPWEEAQVVGALFGEKLILNEFVAFIHLSDLIEDLSPRSEAIVVFSLCGFANLAAIAVLLGGLGTLIPEKRELIGKFGLRAVLAGSLSNLMSAGFAVLILPI